MHRCFAIKPQATAATVASEMNSVSPPVMSRSHLQPGTDPVVIPPTPFGTVAAVASTASPSSTVASTAAEAVARPPSSRPVVRTTSAQLRAQRPRAITKTPTTNNPDTALQADKCGPEENQNQTNADSTTIRAPSVTEHNPKTGERMGPRGLEPTRYGDWEAKGRCWDF